MHFCLDVYLFEIFFLLSIGYILYDVVKIKKSDWPYVVIRNLFVCFVKSQITLLFFYEFGSLLYEHRFLKKDSFHNSFRKYVINGLYNIFFWRRGGTEGGGENLNKLKLSLLTVNSRLRRHFCAYLVTLKTFLNVFSR